eukprot:Colp12_sorted_trinity150504_noHs@8716
MALFCTISTWTVKSQSPTTRLTSPLLTASHKSTFPLSCGRCVSKKSYTAHTAIQPATPTTTTTSTPPPTKPVSDVITETETVTVTSPPTGVITDVITSVTTTVLAPSVQVITSGSVVKTITSSVVMTVVANVTNPAKSISGAHEEVVAGWVWPVVGVLIVVATLSVGGFVYLYRQRRGYQQINSNI